MSEAPGAPVVREMGYSLDEFRRVLPPAMRDWQVTGAAPSWRIDDERGQAVAEIRVTPLAERQLGALRLPVLAVAINLLTPSGEQQAEFWLRFERGFHRGGG